MKSNASIQNAFSFNTALPHVGRWEKSSANRVQYKIRPFALEEIVPSLSERDEQARKQEIICVAILVLSLLFTFGVCLYQLARP